MKLFPFPAACFAAALFAFGQGSAQPENRLESFAALRNESDGDMLAALPGETVILENLVGVRLVGSVEELDDPGFPAAGVDTTRFPWIDALTFSALPPKFIGKPASQASLARLVAALRVYATILGREFVTVYLPPQDITGGYVQIVISEATADAIGVRGARHFSEESYRAAVRQQPGQPIDRARLEEDIAWLNRNPYRRVRVAASSGAAAGTTQLELQVEEQRPWGLSASYDNTGTRSTDEDRVSVGVSWANALGRGDQMSYRFIADPEVEHSKTHALNYVAFLPWRHIATISSSHSEISSIMVEPFTQEGTSWQIGSRYEIPLKPLRNGWAQNLSFTTDFKYSDNNLEFAAIPVTNNVTHIAQFGASYGVSFARFGGQNSATATVYASPGGLTRYNKDSAFRGTRPGAKAEYVYGTLSLTHQHPFASGAVWVTSGTVQFASGALLGSEQLNGGGTYAVRGYRESTAFGDQGVVLNNELHLPGFSLPKGGGNVDVFFFVDAAALDLRVDDESVELASAGVGVNYTWRRYFTLRAAYGWQIKKLAGSLDSGHGHVSANVSW
jgi:Hemolysin activation/secretion protein